MEKGNVELQKLAKNLALLLSEQKVNTYKTIVEKLEAIKANSDDEAVKAKCEELKAHLVAIVNFATNDISAFKKTCGIITRTRLTPEQKQQKELDKEAKLAEKIKKEEQKIKDDEEKIKARKAKLAEKKVAAPKKAKKAE